MNAKLRAGIAMLALLGGAELASYSLLRHWGLRNVPGPFLHLETAPELRPIRWPLRDPLLGWVGAAPFVEHESGNLTPEERSAPFPHAVAGVKRIVALGGSTTDPQLVPENWAYGIARRCAGARIRCRVWNGGVSAYNTSQELLKLIRDVAPQRPDLVISLSGVNDEALGIHDDRSFLTAHQELWERALRAGSADQDSVLRNPWEPRGALPGLRLFLLLARERVTASLAEPAPAAGEPDRLTRAGRFETNARMMHAIAAEFGIPYLMVLQPHLGLDPKPERYRGMAQALASLDRAKVRGFYEPARAFCRRVPWCVDLSGLLVGHSDVFLDAVHLSPAGHALEADALFRILQQRGWR